MAIHTHVSHAKSGGSAEHKAAMRDMFGPGAVESQINSAISTCWMLLPKKKRTPDAVAAEVRRIVERALANLKEDAKAFGFGAKE